MNTFLFFAFQVTSKKESKLEAKGNNRTQDIRIENFDIAYGDRFVNYFTNYLTYNFIYPFKGVTARCRFNTGIWQTLWISW